MTPWTLTYWTRFPDENWEMTRVSIEAERQADAEQQASAILRDATAQMRPGTEVKPFLWEEEEVVNDGPKRKRNTLAWKSKQYGRHA